MLRRIAIFLILFLPVINVASQQLPLYSQYMMNGFMLNSAMAGYDGFTSVNLTARQQWLGIENAPQTFSLSLQTRILKRSWQIKSKPLRNNKFIPARTGRVGLGIVIFSDRNGAFTQTGATMSYAYHIPFPNSQLSFGLSGSLSQFKIDITSSDFRGNWDPKSSILAQPFYVPDANAGVFYTHKDFYAGLSIAQLLQSAVKIGNPGLDAFHASRSYIILAGYKFAQHGDLSYEPSVLIKTTEQLFPQVDLSLKAIYYENYWVGFSYRTTNTLIFLVGIKKNRIYIGYAFDYSFNAFQSYTLGSHELNIALKFGDSAKRYKWLNRY
jgi:type IX secretion system PorP/SprF family membrane protein